MAKNHYDAIVIGAGVAGLTSALKLSGSGKKVQHGESGNPILSAQFERAPILEVRD